MRFGGATLERKDIPRLQGHLGVVYRIMADGQFRTLENIAGAVFAITGKTVTTQSVSARLRDLRKEKFGGFKVSRRNLGVGLFEYQVLAGDGSTINR
ncbi:MAG: hypothetical protein ACREJM_09895 [Candidatus Saccharimonadales bacterium]